jgi:hypothetical protein
MIVNKKIIPVLKKAMFTASAILALTQCNQEDDFIKPIIAEPSVQSSTVTNANTVSISSLTVTGSNTIYATLNDCSSCNYIVAATEEVIKGNKFKAGDIICLNKGIKYGNIEFVDLKGTAENPIVIATVGETTSRVAPEETNSPADPY